MDPQRFSLKDFRLYLAVSGVTAVALFTYNRILGTVALILTAICAYYAYNSAKRYNQELDDRIKYLHKDFEKVTEQTVFAMPFPMAVTDEAGKILWHNSRFSKLWDTSSLQGEFLPKLVDDLATEEKGLKAIESGEEITVAENPYAAYSNLVALSRNGKEDNLCLFYFVDRKEYKDLELLYTDTRGVVLVVEVDNFDEVVDGAPTSKRPLLIAEIDHSINEYFRSRNALVRKFQEDMYLIVMREMDLESVYAQKFDILDTMREIDAGNTISVTISAGVSRPGLAFIDAYREADTCLDVALGRGGDQVVVQTEDNYAYFGGKSKAVEKRNKVKARVLGIALRQLIEKAPRVFVMGHTEYPPILEKTVNVVVVDHHRRGKEFVTDPVLSYVEPYASSTCELITEMLTYMYKDVELTDFEADALMSGIVVDTKNFTFRTGVRTFEAASALKRSGADMSKVRFLFEDDYDTIVSRAEVVHNARIVFDNIAISRLVDDMPNSVLVSAQAADELLGIHGVKASFVLNQKKGVVHISGRSFGEISVQLILERLGGGGHLNMAGAQIEGEDIDEVEHRLVESIQWYLDKGEKES